MEIYFVKLNLT